MRKVFSIVFLQLCVTVGVACVFIFVDPVRVSRRRWQRQGPGIAAAPGAATQRLLLRSPFASQVHLVGSCVCLLRTASRVPRRLLARPPAPPPPHPHAELRAARRPRPVGVHCCLGGVAGETVSAGAGWTQLGGSGGWAELPAHARGEQGGLAARLQQRQCGAAAAAPAAGPQPTQTPTPHTPPRLRSSSSPSCALPRCDASTPGIFSR